MPFVQLEQLEHEQLRDLGYLGCLNDMRFKYYGDMGSTWQTLNERERDWYFISSGANNHAKNDRFKEHLINKGGSRGRANRDNKKDILIGGTYFGSLGIPLPTTNLWGAFSLKRRVPGYAGNAVQVTGTNPLFPLINYHFDEDTSATSFRDFGTSEAAHTNLGTPVTSTAQSVYGGKSLRLNGTSAIKVTKQAAYNVGTGDFTVRCKVRVDAIGLTQNIFASGEQAASRGTVTIRISTGGILQAFGDAGALGLLAGTTVLAANTWYDVALCRSAGTLRLFLNGVLEASSAAYSAFSVSSADSMYIGCLDNTASGGNPQGFLTGYIDEFVFDNIAFYTSATTFTPPSTIFPLIVNPIEIGYTTQGDLNTTALLAAASGGNLYVTRWYGQIGSRYLIPYSGTGCPKIVSAGVYSGKMVNDGSSSLWTEANVSGIPIAFSVYILGTVTDTAKRNRIYSHDPGFGGGDSNSCQLDYANAGASHQALIYGPGSTSYMEPFTGAMNSNVVGTLFDRTQANAADRIKMYYNGVEQTAGTSSTIGGADLTAFVAKPWALGHTGQSGQGATRAEMDVSDFVIYEAAHNSATFLTVSNILLGAGVPA
jgi:hypothetical protein